MDDNEFLEFRNTLSSLSNFGATHAIFPKKLEEKIKDSIRQRYDIISEIEVTLCSIRLVFI